MREDQEAYLFKFHPKQTSPTQRARQRQLNLKRALWGLAASVGAAGVWLLAVQLERRAAAILKPVGMALAIAGVVWLAWGGLAGAWAWYQRQATFIGLTRQKELVMRSVIGSVLWTYRVPLSKVKGIRRIVRASKERGWYFVDRHGRPLARFNADLWPTQRHKAILEAIAEHAPNLEIVIER